MIPLPTFAEKCLKIRTKQGGLAPFVFNHGQRVLHEKIQRQLDDTGKVRMIVLKARQVGISTYTAARYFEKALREYDRKVFILTHLAQSTDALFNIVRTFQANMPFITDTNTLSKTSLSLADTRSEYAVGTARSQAVGRGMTIQMFHGSELGFWENAEENAAAIMQAVPNVDGSEIILESTANGVGNAFHTMAMEAIHDKDSPFQLCFLPWYIHEEYTLPTDSIEYRLDDKEIEIKRAFNLSDGQLLWRRAKIKELTREFLFKQEYPCTPQEAFQTGGEESYISAEAVELARKTKVNDSFAPLVVGVDPALYGNDRTAIVLRRGREVVEIIILQHVEPMAVVGNIVSIIQRANPKKVFIDMGGGATMLSRMRELGYGQIVTGINFGGEATKADKYKNKRSEMWGEMKDWLEEGNVSIPDREDIAVDLLAPTVTPSNYDSNNRFQLESKKDIHKRLKFSPDIGDALALTFAMPIYQEKIGDIMAYGNTTAKFESIFG